MLRDATPLPYDMKVVEEFDLSVLSEETLSTYRNYHASYRPNHPWHKLSLEQYLQMLGAAVDEGKGLHPTMAGILMFGEEQAISRVLAPGNNNHSTPGNSNQKSPE